METVDIVKALAEVGTVGVLLIGVGVAYFIMRRNGKNNNGTAKQLVELMKFREDMMADMVRSLESLAGTLTRVFEEQAKHTELVQRLVDIHIRTEKPMEQLMDQVSRNQKIMDAVEEELKRIARERRSS